VNTPTWQIREPKLTLKFKDSLKVTDQEAEMGVLTGWDRGDVHPTLMYFSLLNRHILGLTLSASLYPGSFQTGNRSHLLEISSPLKFDARIEAGFPDSKAQWVFQEMIRVF
jgi:hypothetical protein